MTLDETDGNTTSHQVYDLSLNKVHTSNPTVLFGETGYIKCSFSPLFLYQWGKTTYVVSDQGVNNFVLVELGSLEFGIVLNKSTLQILLLYSTTWR